MPRPARQSFGDRQAERPANGADHERITVRIDHPVPGVTPGRLRLAVLAALGQHPVGSLSVAVVDDATISSLHERYLGQTGPTDVISFDLRDEDGNPAVQGEIVISAETAGRQARLFKAPVSQEVLRYAIHGTLHLLGLDDRTPGQRRRMRREENRLLAALSERVGPASTRVGPASSRSFSAGPARRPKRRASGRTRGSSASSPRRRRRRPLGSSNRE